MNTSSVLLSGSSGLDEINVSNTSVSQPPKETKTEQNSLKSFKLALEEQDAKVSGGESAKAVNTNAEVKEEVKASEPEEESKISLYVSEKQSNRSEETDESPALPMFTPIITALPEPEAGSRNALTTIDAWFQNVQPSAMPVAEENMKSGKSNSADKTNTGNSGANISSGGFKVSTGNDILTYNFNINTGDTEKGEIPDPGALLSSSSVISSQKSTKEGVSIASKAVALDTTKGEILNMNSLLGRTGGDQQSDLNREGRQQADVLRNEVFINPKTIVISQPGNELAGSLAKLTRGESKVTPVNVRKILNVQPREGELPQQGEAKPVDVRQVQFSAAFGQRDAGMMLDDSVSARAAGDEPNFSTLKGAAQGGVESSAGVSVSETGKTDTKHPLQEISAKVIEQVREPLVQAVKKGVDHIQLRLKPDGLGELRIDLRVQGGRLNMHILTDNVTTRQALEFGLPDLKGQLSGSGISVGDTNIEHDEGKGRDENHAGQRDRHPQGRNNNKQGNQNFREYFA